MATLKFPDSAGESACTYNGSTTLTLSGTALTGGRTFANAAADTDIDFDDGDLVAVKAIDADGDFEIWTATWASAGATLTKVSRISVHNTLATTGVTIYAVPSGYWFTEIEKVRLEHDTAAPVGSNVTAAVGKWYNMDLSGLTAARLFVLPDSVAVGSLIGLRVNVAAPSTAAYVLKVATAASGSELEGVESSSGSADYVVLTAGESLFFRTIKNGGAGDTDWVVDHDNRKPIRGQIKRTADQTGITASADDLIECNVEGFNRGVETDTGGADGSYPYFISPRRAGKYRITAYLRILSINSGSDRQMSPIVTKNGSSLFRFSDQTELDSTSWAPIFGASQEHNLAVGDKLQLWVYHSSPTSETCQASLQPPLLGIEEML